MYYLHDLEIIFFQVLQFLSWFKIKISNYRAKILNILYMILTLTRNLLKLIR